MQQHNASKKPSPFEATLSKNSPHPSNECFTRRENPKNRVAMFSQYRQSETQRKYILKIIQSAA